MRHGKIALLQIRKMNLEKIVKRIAAEILVNQEYVECVKKFSGAVVGEIYKIMETAPITISNGYIIIKDQIGDIYDYKATDFKAAVQ